MCLKPCWTDLIHETDSESISLEQFTHGYIPRTFSYYRDEYGEKWHTEMKMNML